MKKAVFFISISIFMFSCYSQKQGKRDIIIDETNKNEIVEQTIEIDSVWAGHPVGFCLYTNAPRQYIAYYNANRNMVVGQRNLNEDKFQLHTMKPTARKTSGGTSTVLDWDSHNYVTLSIDKDGFIHLSGNVHAHPLTYFRSTIPHDISTLEQIFEMVGVEENRTTYPNFMLTDNDDLLYHYRNGGSGNGNEVYNIYSTETKQWLRLLDTSLTDGEGLMNAYQTQPKILADGWYHMYWVWRDTPDCSTNHDLSYMKSPDLKNWFNAFGEHVELPATFSQKHLIVDPIPVKGGIINLAAKLCLDDNNKPVFVYHKYDSKGYIQLYVAETNNGKWNYKQITDWDYRWEFSGSGSINFDITIDSFNKRQDGFYEVSYSHIKYGKGTLLLNDNFENCGEVIKPTDFASNLQIEGEFPGLNIRTAEDIGKINNMDERYILKWETLKANRDQPYPKPWPSASKLYLYRLKKNSLK